MPLSSVESLGQLEEILPVLRTHRAFNWAEAELVIMAEWGRRAHQETDFAILGDPYTLSFYQPGFELFGYEKFFLFLAAEPFGYEGGTDVVTRDGEATVFALGNGDTMVIDELRNFLFGPPGAGGFDLASLNIQRGRDHGLADYNSVREAYGLPRAVGFEDVSLDPGVQERLAAAYGDVDAVDLWVGGLAEDALEPLVRDALHALDASDVVA